MKRKHIIISIVAFAIVLSSIAIVKAASSTVYSNTNFLLNPNSGEGHSFNSPYGNIITDFSPRTIIGPNPRKTKYEAYLITGGSMVLKQSKTYGITTSASGYFNMGYVGAGEVEVDALSKDGFTAYAGWIGTQRYISQS